MILIFYSVLLKTMTVKSKIVKNIILPHGYDITSQISCFSNVSYVNISKIEQYKNSVIIHMNVNVNTTKVVDHMIHFKIDIPILTEKIDIISIKSNVDLKFEMVKNKYEVDGRDKFLLAIYSTPDTYINKIDTSYREDNYERKRERERGRSRSRSRSRSYDHRHNRDKDSKSHHRKHDKDSRSRSRSRDRHRDRKYSRDRGRSRSPEHKRRTQYHDDLEERIRNEIRKEYEEKERQQYAHFPIPYHSNHPMIPPHMIPLPHMMPPPHYGYHQQGVPMPPPGASMPLPPPFF